MDPGIEAGDSPFERQRIVKGCRVKTEPPAFLHRQCNVVVFTIALFADQFVLLVFPDEPLHIQRRRTLHVTPTVAPIFDVISHLDRILLRALARELDVEESLERRRVELLVCQPNQFSPHTGNSVFHRAHKVCFLHVSLEFWRYQFSKPSLCISTNYPSHVSALSHATFRCRITESHTKGQTLYHHRHKSFICHHLTHINEIELGYADLINTRHAPFRGKHSAHDPSEVLFEYQHLRPVLWTQHTESFIDTLPQFLRRAITQEGR